ncbi:hypothetical protein SISSUDRAFT_387003 [Sistotremastrum suecicum HHB10207 ss-3]|uniref:Uncharacterized protein n=1 Tax=Sistotremastrum suecicum HHB10207 ss-3 TaxID=1314776 RepID=A0A166FVP3_9AGAM|nr:hypothetical protein SISSUDRAFT_387003 [Sistotremastrum suecicum HHB10207 ss-3]
MLVFPPKSADVKIFDHRLHSVVFVHRCTSRLVGALSHQLGVVPQRCRCCIVASSRNLRFEVILEYPSPFPKIRRRQNIRSTSSLSRFRASLHIEIGRSTVSPIRSRSSATPLSYSRKFSQPPIRSHPRVSYRKPIFLFLPPSPPLIYLHRLFVFTLLHLQPLSLAYPPMSGDAHF